MSLLVVRTGFLGDTICAIPAFTRLREHAAGRRLILAADLGIPASFRSSDVADYLGVFDAIAPYRTKNRWLAAADLFRLARHYAVEEVVALPQYEDSQLSLEVRRTVFRAAGVKVIRGFNRARKEAKPLLPETWRLLDHLSACGIESRRSAPSFLVKSPDIEKARQTFSSWGWLDQKVLCFCGGGKDPVQKWSPERYVNVLQSILHKLPIRVLGLGAGRDSEYYERELPADRCKIIKDNLALGEVAGLMSECYAYLGNDTGPLHLAASLGLPVAGLFSARSEVAQWYPVGVPSLILVRRLVCEGCQLHVCTINQHRCLQEMGVEEVTSHVLPFLEKSLRGQLSTPSASEFPQWIEVRGTKE